MLKKFRVLYIIMEWNQMFSHKSDRITSCSSNKMRDMITYLLSQGYRPFRLDPSNVGKPLNVTNLTSDVWPNVNNLYWKRNDVPDASS